MREREFPLFVMRHSVEKYIHTIETHEIFLPRFCSVAKMGIHKLRPKNLELIDESL